MTLMPTLETERLLIRPFTTDDLDAVHQLLDIELAQVDFGSEGAKARDERERWLRWTVLGYEELAKLYQPPYGDRAVALKQNGVLIGAIGYVPCLAPFEQLRGFAPSGGVTGARLNSAECGLFYAFAPAHQRRGYASEATRAMIAYAFTQLRLKRVVATTTYDNAASIGVMRSVGMRIEQNPYPDPPWLQVVGAISPISHL